MAVTLNTKFAESFLSEEKLASFLNKAEQALITLQNGTGAGNDFIGWVNLPKTYDKEEFARILVAAEKVKKNCDIFVVIGIGGSYLGARAAIEFVKSPLYNALDKDTPDIYYIGNNISASALSELLSLCKDKNVCVNVISKSGTTTEPAIAFRVFRALLEERYGKEGARERIYVTTSKDRGTLKSFSDERGYETFVIPDDVGGRFSVLTAVGLLPIAVAGIDIEAMMQGAIDAMNTLSLPDATKNDALRYAALRNHFLSDGKTTEILAGYEPSLQLLNEWWKQLYGESEGKDCKGIFPASVIFSTDLHSLGQFIQDGNRNIFETVISLETPADTFRVPEDPENIDGLNFLSGKLLDEINKTAMLGTLCAHVDGGVPNILVEVKDRSAYSFGYLVYFFELACAVSGYILGVNPFNQPGVESYKKNMFALLGKPGYEELRADLEKRLG